MHPHPLAAVLFDMDGLLVDSEPVWTIAEVELAESLGGSWDSAIKTRVIGTSVRTAVPIILEHFKAAHRDPAEVIHWLLGRMVELFQRELPVMPGAHELVDGLRAAGVPVALVSSSYRVLVDAVLHAFGTDRFDFTLSGDEVTHTKPHPEPYAKAAAALGVDPGRCVVLEDAPSGIASAEAAGCIAIGVTGHAPLEATACRPVFDALTDIDLDWLLQLPQELRRAG
jgi:HAD superfamily hydrolase (TIGR01509 family)